MNFVDSKKLEEFAEEDSYPTEHACLSDMRRRHFEYGQYMIIAVYKSALLDVRELQLHCISKALDLRHDRLQDFHHTRYFYSHNRHRLRHRHCRRPLNLHWIRFFNYLEPMACAGEAARRTPATRRWSWRRSSTRTTT
ncbi:Protein of unknown function [Gryllus bimaculatus]|nr:Protein of unknown function [Gryllus bimaculatus]